MSRRPEPPGRACIVGAGSSGLAAAAVLRERGIPFQAFELGSDVGGLWRFENDSGRSVAYASLRANTSRDRTAFARFRMPPEYPDFPEHSQLLRYFELFADRFGLRERIAFRTEVVRVAPAGRAAGESRGGESRDGGARGGDERERRWRWDVTVRDLATGAERTEGYDAVLVASGHHWDPIVPELPGRFDGLTLHSSRYRTPAGLEGRRVLVVGIGNSACDIACEACGAAQRTLLSTRRGAHVFPKYLFSRPIDHWISPSFSRLPLAIQRAVLGALLRLDRGHQRRYGVPAPPYPLGSEHPTISQDLLRFAREGRIAMKPEIERLEGSHVRFVDGSEEQVDVIIFATGYRISFPLLVDGLIAVRDNRVPLYLHVVPPDVPGLFFLGLIQPLGAIPPLAEAQSEWVADLLEGTAASPPPEEMWAAIQRAERKIEERFVASSRHTMEVDFFPYLRAIAGERRRGRRRAALAREREGRRG